MLALADRNFLSLRLFKLYVKAGADLVWRIKSNVATHDREDLSDASRVLARGGCQAPRPAAMPFN
jgi:hypothetical protein